MFILFTTQALIHSDSEKSGVARTFHDEDETNRTIIQKVCWTTQQKKTVQLRHWMQIKIYLLNAQHAILSRQEYDHNQVASRTLRS